MPNLFSAVQITLPLILQKHRMDIALMYLLVFCMCLDHNCLFHVFVAAMYAAYNCADDTLQEELYVVTENIVALAGQGCI